MPQTFTIPNEADASNSNQAEPDKVDLDILVAAFEGTGVAGGCDVTAQGTPDMTVAVAAGTTMLKHNPKSVSGGNVTLTADGTNPRFSLICVNGTTGAIAAATAGTPSSNPVFPAIPTDHIVLAAVFIPAADTAIQTNQISPKQVRVAQGPLLASKVWNGASETTFTTTSTTAQAIPDATQSPAAQAVVADFQFSFIVPPSGKVMVKLSAARNSAAGVQHYWSLRDEADASIHAAGQMDAIVSTRRIQYTGILTGLTPGVTKTFTWCQRTGNVTNSVTILAGGVIMGPAVMEVWRLDS